MSKDQVLKSQFILPEILLNEKSFFDSFTIAEINDFCGMERMSLTRSEEFPETRATYVTTPNGSRVYISSKIETHTPEQHFLADDSMAHAYGVTLLSMGDCRYNCHSYAWYVASNSNQYWMDDPSPYMSDGSYSKTSSPSSNKRIYYNGTHSGIMIDSTKVKSKWGNMGVFNHHINSVPSDYDTQNITYWLWSGSE